MDKGNIVTKWGSISIKSLREGPSSIVTEHILSLLNVPGRFVM